MDHIHDVHAKSRTGHKKKKKSYKRDCLFIFSPYIRFFFYVKDKMQIYEINVIILLSLTHERIKSHPKFTWTPLCICPDAFSSQRPNCRPRWLSWKRHPTGDQEVAGSTPTEVGNILPWRLIMKYFLQSFSPFRWFKKGSCQFLAKECAQYWLTAWRTKPGQ